MRAVALLLFVVVLRGGAALVVPSALNTTRWTEAQANEWYNALPWLVGANFAPSSAINQLEMWQADTFDVPGIARDLDLARGLGFNTLRVFLHQLPWQVDRDGFVRRIDEFLGMTSSRGIRVMFVLFDSCWDPYPKTGTQRAPRPHVHNSGWVQSPGLEVLTDVSRHDELQDFVVGIISHFARDARVLTWDIFNEPDNRNDISYGQFEPGNKADLALQLLNKAFAWARSASPSQPLSSGVWGGDWSRDEFLTPLQRAQLDQSDVINFHNYGVRADTQNRINWLRRYNRPILCTEYMARPIGSTFETIMPMLKQERVAAYNWGFVDGKTQTIYPWDSWQIEYTGPPPLWFHDIFNTNGTPYNQSEVDLIRSLTGVRH